MLKDVKSLVMWGQENDVFRKPWVGGTENKRIQCNSDDGNKFNFPGIEKMHGPLVSTPILLVSESVWIWRVKGSQPPSQNTHTIADAPAGLSSDLHPPVRAELSVRLAGLSSDTSLIATGAGDDHLTTVPRRGGRRQSHLGSSEVTEHFPDMEPTVDSQI